jgi:hypothetical protein
MYQLVTYPEGVIDLDKDMFYPNDPANTDYQAYQAWLAEGNTPLPPEGN